MLDLADEIAYPVKSIIRVYNRKLNADFPPSGKNIF